MNDRWNEALEAAADKLLVRACGYLARYDTIYNGRIVSEELLCLAKAILALREADQRGADAEAFSPSRSHKHTAQSAPHHPGRQELASSDQEGHLQAINDTPESRLNALLREPGISQSEIIRSELIEDLERENAVLRERVAELEADLRSNAESAMRAHGASFEDLHICGNCNGSGYTA